LRASKITAIDFFDDLTSKYARRRFFLAFTAIFIICLIGIWVASATANDTIVRSTVNGILTNVASACLVTLLFYSTYVFLIGENSAQRDVVALRPADIGERLKILPLDTRHYALWGRSGSFFRASSLLELDRQSKESKRRTVVDVLLPDPEDDRLVRSYRDILQALGEDQGPNPLLPNVLATCIVAAIVAANNKHLEISIHLSKFLPAFRIDLSENGAILTQDDPRKSALFFEYGTEFYDMFETTIANERTVSTRLNWDPELFRNLALTEASCTDTVLGAFGFGAAQLQDVRAEVATLVASRPHRYK
jgi:hypothetical protein